jgi:hypothetical protein
MKSLSDCAHCCKKYERTQKWANAGEKGLTYSLENVPKLEIEKWKIDGCVLKENDLNKCDYLMVIKKRSTCYWIELKDQDLDYACLQIFSAFNSIKEARTYKRHLARIVLGRFNEDRNRIDNLRYVNFKKLINLIGGKQNVWYKTKIIEEKL